jgi:hypothetical protein
VFELQRGIDRFAVGVGSGAADLHCGEEGEVSTTTPTSTPSPTLAYQYVVVVAELAETYGRTRSVFKFVDDAVSAAATALASEQLVGVYREIAPAKRPGKKAARKEAARLLREQIVAAAHAEFSAMFPDVDFSLEETKP